MADNEIVAIFFNMADRNCKSKWLSIIGIGEDGLEGLSSVGRSLGAAFRNPATADSGRYGAPNQLCTCRAGEGPGIFGSC